MYIMTTPSISDLNFVLFEFCEWKGREKGFGITHYFKTILLKAEVLKHHNVYVQCTVHDIVSLHLDCLRYC